MSELEADYQPTSDSFWEVGQYKTTVKRAEDGFKLCNEFMSLVEERCQIEKAYAKSLKHWSKKWNEAITKGPEYGTTQGAWRGLLEEADRLNEIHTEVKNDLLTEVHTSVKQWQKDNYHKNMVGAIKETKDFEDSFKKVQKPWAKRLNKVIKCKKDYHNCCKTEKSLKVQLANAKGDSAITPENVKKAQDKADKSERDTESSKDKYTSALAELNSYNAKYMEEMTEVYDNCQVFEEKRLHFFKDVMFTMHKCLNISEKEKFPIIYDDLHATIEKTESSQDLKWWTNTYGTGMAMAWPAFEEYSPELKPINKGKATTGDGITLKGVSMASRVATNFHNNHSEKNDIHRETAPPDVQHGNRRHKPATRQTSYDPNLNPFGDQEDDNVNAQNPFGDEWDTHDLTDDGTPGVAVRALYDYAALEDDELNLKAGDIFRRLSEEDGQGWCKGRKDGTVGLYPANYAETV